MSGIERVGNSSSTGPTLKSGEKSQFSHQINIMNLKQNSGCNKSIEKKPVSQQRNLGSSNQTMQHTQHMGDDVVNGSQSVTQTMESTQTLINDSQDLKKRSMIGHRYSAAV